MTMHLRLLTTTSNTRLPFLIPQSHMILCANHPAYPPNFPAGIQPCQTYVQERSPALPVAVRETLVARYCPPKLQEQVRNSRRDEDCLVRVYCGKRRSAADAAKQKRFFSLRNYNLCVDQMEELGLEIDALVGVLAKALATCYFVAQIDANDCEFVFGLPRGVSDAAEEEKSVEPWRRENVRVFNMLRPNMAGKDDTMCENMTVWMLYFDCVRRISMDKRDLRQAAHAFWRNDPYFLRPWAHNHTLEDVKLWSVFVFEFLGESGRILARQIESDGRADAQSKYEKRVALAMWVRQVEAEGNRRRREARIRVWVDDVAENTEDGGLAE
jgi:hypothetical protein